MKQTPIGTVKHGRVASEYRVLLSPRRPPAGRSGSAGVWMPGLLPSHALRRNYAEGVISRRQFADQYARELKGGIAQNFLKPLALLSARKKLVLVCDCPGPCGCPLAVLAGAIRECRRRRDFRMSFPPRPSDFP